MLWGIHVYRTRNIVGAEGTGGGRLEKKGWERTGSRSSKEAGVIYFTLQYFQKRELKIFLTYI